MISKNSLKVFSILASFLFLANHSVLGQCIASFTTVDNGNGNYSFTSQMANGSGGNSYIWDFGDGNISTQANPTNIYTASGTYIATVNIIDSSACSSTYSDTLQVIVSGCYTAYNYTDNGGGNFTFTSTSSGNYNYSWDFGDGNTNNVPNPNYTYSAAGTYNVCLIVTDTALVCSDTVCQSIIVSLCNLSANFTSVDNGNGNFVFTPTINNGSAPYVYSWDFGDGNYSTSGIPSHTYNNPGSYPVVLNVTDNNGCTAMAFDSITFSSNCNASYNYTDNGGGSFSFASTSIGGLNYYWDFGDGSTNNIPNPNHTFTAAGTYNVCLAIEDSANACNDTICVSINVSLCNLIASFTATDNGGGNIDFTSSSTNSSGGDTYSWNFGDGNISTQTNPSHTYSNSGMYIISLGITDSNNCSSSYMDTLLINSNACNMNTSFTYTDNGAGNYTFTNTTSGSFTSLSWNFGDGTTSNLTSPSHTFLANGVFVVQLVTIDSILACYDSELMTIQVTGVANPVNCNASFVITTDSLNPNNAIIYNTSTGSGISYLWDFGDGNTSTLASPNYTYSSNGPFQLCLTVDDGLGCTSTYCDSIGTGGTVLKQSGFSFSTVTPIITNIKNETSTFNQVYIYPNPFKNDVTISLNVLESSQTEVFVTDVIGNRVALISNSVLNAGINQFNWKANNIVNGVYLLNIKTENSLQVKKLILNR